MNAPRMKVADLDPESLAKIQAFEAKSGKVVVALAPRYTLAELTRDEMRELQALEEQLDVVLMAYEKV